MTRRPPPSGVHHVNAGLDAAVSRLADRAEGQEPSEADVLPLTRPSGPPAIVLFVRLHDAVRRADYRAAAHLRRELFALGWSVVPRPEARERLLTADRDASVSSRGGRRSDPYEVKGPATARLVAGPSKLSGQGSASTPIRGRTNTLP